MFRLNKKQVLSLVASVAVSVFAVALVASATTYIDTASVGVASSTVGAAVAVKGAAIFDGFVSADYFTSTSTGSSWMMGNLGIGTTTPGSRIGVKGTFNAGSVVAEGSLKSSYLVATSTTATSTIGFGLTAGGTSNTLVIDAGGNGVGVGTTTLPAVNDITMKMAVGDGTATTSVYISGGASAGSSIILKSADGRACGELMYNQGAAVIGLGTVAATFKPIACPE